MIKLCKFGKPLSQLTCMVYSTHLGSAVLVELAPLLANDDYDHEDKEQQDQGC